MTGTMTNAWGHVTGTRTDAWGAAQPHLKPLLLRAPVQQLLDEVVAKRVHHQLHNGVQHLWAQHEHRCA